MDRNEAVWYYRLGEQTLGPVSWAEIEQITRDTFSGTDLLVARGGDAGWMTAADALAANPELAAAAEPPAPAQPVVTESVETSGDWSVFDEEEPAPAATAPGQMAPAPSHAASEVLGGAAVTRDAGRYQAPAMPGAMRPREGLGSWIGQAWEMVIGDLASFALGTLLAAVVTIVTIGICGPPLQAGLFIMALKRYRGEPISAGTVFEGFQFFLPAWGIALIQGLLGAIAGGIVGGVLGAALGAAGMSQETIQAVAQFVGGIIGLVIGAAFFYAWVLMVDRGMGTIEAIQNSWTVTSEELLSYIGTVFVLQLLVAAGAIACGVGLLVTVPMMPCTVVAAYMWRFRNISRTGAVL